MFNHFRFSVSLAYYGISLSIPDLSGDRYFNFMIGKITFLIIIKQHPDNLNYNI